MRSRRGRRVSRVQTCRISRLLPGAVSAIAVAVSAMVFGRELLSGRMRSHIRGATESALKFLCGPG